RRLMRPRVDKRRSEHVSQSEESYRSAGTRILILGAGFGGLAAALKLDQQLRPSDDISILAVDRNNDMLFTPLLWTVANGRTSPNNVVVPIREFQKGRQFHVLHAEIESIDLDRKEVRTSAGTRPYDRLVIALGSHTAVPDLPGLRTYALPFHTPANALQLRNHLIDAVETSAEVIPARTLFWAAGTTAPDIVRHLPVQHAPNGAVIVDDHLRISGHPEVYVIGDSAWAYDSSTGAPVAATGQAARQQGY